MNAARFRIVALEVVLVCGSAVLPAVAAAEDAAAPTIERTLVFEAVGLPPVGVEGETVGLGGISDLCAARLATESAAADGPGAALWIITDRGPNGTTRTAAGRRRTLVAPWFTPRVMRFDAAGLVSATAAPGDIVITPAADVPLLTASGRPTSGRPNGIGRDETMLDERTKEPLASDPDGLDTEGLAVAADGTFWIAEEYRPSLAHVAADGRVLRRLVPEGQGIPEADAEIKETLPAVYGRRRDNRGFESLALLAGGRRLVTMVQSPLDLAPGPASSPGNLRMLVVDTDTGRPVAEHVYRAGTPTRPDYLNPGCPPPDVKVCALAAVGDETLLVLEQGDDGSARLFAVECASASDTLPRTRRGDEPPLEAIADLPAAGIEPVAKRLVADLAPLVPRFRSDARLSADAPLKLEGIALLDAGRIAMCNDDDFAVACRPEADPRPRSCLWVVKIPAGLPAHRPHTVRQ